MTTHVELAKSLVKAEAEYSARVRQVAEAIMALPEMRERLSAADRSTQQPPTNPPDGQNQRSDIWRLANLGHKYRDRITIVLEDGPQVTATVNAVVHMVNDEQVLIRCSVLESLEKQSDGTSISDPVD